MIKNTTKVTEHSSGHFIVSQYDRIEEIFMTSTGLLSDGNVLDGIEINIRSERERIIEENFNQNKSGDAGTKSKGIVLKAPMPGMVRSISIAVGDKVEKHTQVLVLEAMKMENSIMAGYDGFVSKIHIQTGTSVDKGMPLIEFTT